MDQHLTVHGRGEDRSGIFELVPHLRRVREIAIVRERDVPIAKACENRLGILDCGRPGRAVPGMTDRNIPFQCRETRRRQSFGNKAHRLEGFSTGLDIHCDDAGRFLAAMLQRIEAEVRERCRLRMSVNSEDAAHMSDSRELRFRISNHCRRRRHDVWYRVVPRS